MIDYKDQSAQKLDLKLLGRPPDLDKLTVLKHREVEIHPLLLRAFIIGESHIVWVQIDELCLFEIFSCSQLELSSDVLLSHPISELAKPKQISYECFDYCFACTVKKMESSMDYIQEMLASRKDWSANLSFDFPKDPAGKHSGQSEQPKTVLAVACNEGSPIIVNSLHSYPNESQIVLTKTTITRRQL